jgi:hypothetical protein
VYLRKVTTCTYLNNAKSLRYKWTCSGVKHCQYLRPELRDIEHVNVTKDLWQQIKALRLGIDFTEPNLIRRHSNAYNPLYLYFSYISNLPLVLIVLSKNDLKIKEHVDIQLITAHHSLKEMNIQYVLNMF